MKNKLPLLLGLLNFALCLPLFAQSSAFTYQGLLNDTNGVVNGTYDFRFVVYNAAIGGLFTDPETNSPVNVSNGLFTVAIDFGSDIFNGPDRWLEIGVRTNGTGAFSTLAPRQKLTPTPYAISITGVVPSGGIAGLYSNPVGFTNNGSVFVGYGAGLIGVNAVTFDGLASSNYWRRFTTPGTESLETIGNRAIELKANGHRALRLEPSPDAANVIGGSESNIVSAALRGATIAGGGESSSARQQITADYGTIGGGHANLVSGYEATLGGGNQNIASGGVATIGGGFRNTASGLVAVVAGGDGNWAAGTAATVSGGNANVSSGDHATISGGGENINPGDWAAIGGGLRNTNSSDFSFIGGGERNLNQADHAAIAGGERNVSIGDWAAIGGGFGNRAATNAVVGGGQQNSALGTSAVVGGGVENQALTNNATIGGGQENIVGGTLGVIGGGLRNRLFSDYATIAGGDVHTISNFSPYATIGGGHGNVIGTNSGGATIIGGSGNIVRSNAPGATIAGGAANVAAGIDSFAAGQVAQALHSFTFVWSGSSSTFASTASGQFLVNAPGGFGIGTAAPTKTLDVRDFGAQTGSIHIGGGSTGGEAKLIHFGDLDISGDNQAYVSIGELDVDDRMRLVAGNFVFTNKSGSGSVGIGRIAAVNKLEVQGDASKTTAGGWLANSDRRIKQDIRDVAGARKSIMKLHPVTFRYTDEWRKRNPCIQDRPYYNFIAQEYRHVFPNAVKGSGEFLDGDPEEILQLDTHDAQIVTVRAVQELIEQNESQRAEIESLKQRLESLERIVANVRSTRAEP